MWKKIYHKREGAKPGRSIALRGSSSNSETIAATDSFLDSNKETLGLGNNPGPSGSISGSIIAVPDRAVEDPLRQPHENPIGLSVIYEPESPATIDIIFVHGLGGTSRNTWSKNKNPELFWPHKWLPTEPGITTARVLSFGYNANFLATGPPSLSGIADFAKDLLYAMKFGKDGRAGELFIGTRPVIFVVHSMGGLVVKKAYLLGQNDEAFKDIVSSINAILFLATPHRGTDLADILNKILSISFFNTSKQYIAELKRNSPALEELNDQFRNIAPKLQIFSFYETRPTIIASRNVLVLPKDSAILGYPGEVSKSMDADHHDVCKYASRQDANYLSVRNALKTLVSKFRASGSSAILLGDESEQNIRNVGSLLAVTEKPDDDYLFFQGQWMQGTCEWILSEPVFMNWLQESPKSNVLWLYALPASGKSVLSSYIINHLSEKGMSCEYYYFRFSDQTKRSTSSCLRSLAFQIAHQIPAFCQALGEMGSMGLAFEKADAKTIWQKLFVSILFKMELPHNLYWIIDALDESDAPKMLVDMLSSIASSNVKINVLIISRLNPDPELTQSFERLRTFIPVDLFSASGGYRDIEMFVEKEMGFMHSSDELKKKVAKKLHEMADGNFLWVNLAVNEIVHHCYTEEDIEEALETISSGMTPLYEQMESSIVRSFASKPTSLALAKAILTWTACSRRPMTLEELSQALQPKYQPILDMKYTINQVCGNFIVIDGMSRVLIVHQTAREYLTRIDSHTFAINLSSAHEELFVKCIAFLDELNRSRRPSHIEPQPFHNYAATSWVFHLNRTSEESDAILSKLVGFLSSSSVLAWISTLATIGELPIMVLASRSMLDFVRRKRKQDSVQNPLLHRLLDIELVERWAADLLKIVGKFGSDLISNPQSIYSDIPPFCPRNTPIYQKFGNPDTFKTSVVVNGLSNDLWDDSLAKILVGRDIRTEMILCSGVWIAIVTSLSQVVLYDAVSLVQRHILCHNEHIFAMTMDWNSEKIATYGLKTTKVWSTSSGKELYNIVNPARSRALDITFDSSNSSLLIGSQDRTIRAVELPAKQNLDPLTWFILDPHLLKEESPTNAPSSIAFNADATQVAISYRKFPLSVWTLDPTEMIGRCKRKKSTDAVSAADHLTWHPHTGEVLGRYIDGSVFKWHPFNDTHEEISAGASDVCCSPEGTHFATSDASGTIKIFDYHHFSLVYQLSSERFVVDLAFSPDGRRLYDLRGEFCNAWEPNALIRLNANDDQVSIDPESEGASTPQSSLVSEVWADLRSPITAIAIQPGGRYHAAGNDEGVVSIHNGLEFPKLDLWKNSSSFSSVRFLNWGEDGKHIACVELSGRLTVKCVEPPNSPSDGWTVNTIIDGKVEGAVGSVQQVLLSPDSQHLLVGSKHSATLWSLEDNSVHMSLTFPRKTRWTTHPSRIDLLIAFDFNGSTIYQWDTLAIVEYLPFDELSPNPLTSGLDLNEWQVGFENFNGGEMEAVELLDVILSSGKTHVIIPYRKSSTNGSPEHNVLILDASSFRLPTENSRCLLSQVPIPKAIMSSIHLPLGVLQRHGLVFLDEHHRMCSWKWKTDDGIGSIRRHFFLPKDWLDQSHLKLCALLEDGTFICPKNGEVASIRSELNSKW